MLTLHLPLSLIWVYKLQASFYVKVRQCNNYTQYSTWRWYGLVECFFVHTMVWMMTSMCWRQSSRFLERSVCVALWNRWLNIGDVAMLEEGGGHSLVNCLFLCATQKYNMISILSWQVARCVFLCIVLLMKCSVPYSDGWANRDGVVEGYEQEAVHAHYTSLSCEMSTRNTENIFVNFISDILWLRRSFPGKIIS